MSVGWNDGHVILFTSFSLRVRRDHTATERLARSHFAVQTIDAGISSRSPKLEEALDALDADHPSMLLKSEAATNGGK